MIWVLLGAIGIVVGTFGTLIGAAGGFLLIPVLFYLYPDESPATITSITLAVAFFNALSGSIAYGRLKRIDYRSGLLFSLIAVPGAMIGASITSFLNRDVFQIVFGITLVLISAYLFRRPERRYQINNQAAGHTVRTITDSHNKVFTYSFSRPLGMGVAFVVGLISGLLGIGGGIIHVPALTQLLNFPTHIATAVSQFVVATTTFAAVDVHIFTGAFAHGIRRAAVLSAGAIIGAQFGARLSQRAPGVLIIRLLAIGLGIVALRLIIAPF